MEKLKEKLKIIDKFKYPLIVLSVGLLLMLLPGFSSASAKDDNELQTVLSSVKGVGEARVIVSEHGVVIVCEGSENASVRLALLEAVKAYTGFTSDKISVLRMKEQNFGR